MIASAIAAAGTAKPMAQLTLSCKRQCKRGLATHMLPISWLAHARDPHQWMHWLNASSAYHNMMLQHAISVGAVSHILQDVARWAKGCMCECMT
jgi:hypothetical protein